MIDKTFNEDAIRRMDLIARKMGEIFADDNLMLYPIDEGGVKTYETFGLVLSGYHSNFMHRTLDQASRSKQEELRRTVAVSESRKKIADLSDDMPEDELREMLNPKGYKTALVIESTNSTGISTISGAIFVARYADVDSVYQFSVTDRDGTVHFCCYPLFLDENKRYKGPEGRLNEIDLTKTSRFVKENGLIRIICPDPPEGYRYPIIPTIYKQGDKRSRRSLNTALNLIYLGGESVPKKIWSD